ncbi:MAG: nitrous oxide reductase family maturation protein NosD [Saprospiraceae bacterium]|nr:nitrous oxide reductase family maturation protein NosD [Candidatus Vicinibacter affinis]
MLKFSSGPIYISRLQSKKHHIFLILVLTAFVVSSLQANAVWVGEQHSIKSIREGIQKTPCGDTLFVDKGFYQEGNLVIDKSIALIGLHQPILDGGNQVEILTISAVDVTVAGFVFQNSGSSSMGDFASIKCIDCSYIYLLNNKIINSFFGIHFSNSDHGMIIKNVIKGNPTNEQNTGNGIHVWKSTDMHISDNEVSGHRDGIYFEFVTASLIERNHSFENIRYALHFMFSHQDMYIHNNFYKNGAGVAVMYSHHVLMYHNNFEKNWGSSAFGILLKEISDSKIEYNTFTDNTVGIYMEGTSRIIVSKNKFFSNGWALKIQASCNENEINENNFFKNTFDVASNGTMVLNSFTQNYWDKYEGYDLAKDGIGDIPYHPLNLYSVLVEQNPSTLILLRSFLISILDRAEKVIPVLTPADLVDNKPSMNPVIL